MTPRGSGSAVVATRRAARMAIVTLVGVTGCLASKGDIRLIQDEIRATRAQLGIVDTSILRTNDQRQRQIAALSATVERLSDSIRTLTVRLATFERTVNGSFDAIANQMTQTQNLLSQTTRNLQDTRQQLEAIREQAAAAPTAPPNPGDTTNRASGVPGPGTLYRSAFEQLQNGANATARSGFELLVSTYPNSLEAPRAQLYIADSYVGDGNKAAADSVYLLVVSKYAKTAPDEAATALFKHGKYLWDTKKTNEARGVLNRVIKEYPGSPAAGLANDFLRNNR